jgi:ubiquinol-cytochrome c reductase iron-sulfur subunit
LVLCKKSNQNNLSNKKSNRTIDESRRQFLLNGMKVLGGIGAFFAIMPFISAWNPSRKILEKNGPLQVDLSGLSPGQQITVEWRGKPIWIIYRSESMLAKLNKKTNELRDPDSLVLQQPNYAKNKYRSRNPKYLVLVGLCTHLGCSPKLQSNDKISEPDGFYCPCHGSRFDLSGRVYRGMPAPINLEVPPHRFLQDDLIEIGEV